MAENYGLDELFRDLTGIGKSTPPKKTAPAPTPTPRPRQSQPAARPAPPPPPPPPSSRGTARGDRNNNPGNLEDGPFARKQPGYIGSDGRFARFSTPAAGHAAQVTLLRGGKYRDKSVADIIQTYAPLGDNPEDSVRNYIGYVSSRLGIDPTKPVPQDKVAAMAGAMREFENGRTQNRRFQPYQGSLRGRQMANQGGGQGVTPAGNYERWLESAIPPEVAASAGVRLPAGVAETVTAAPGKIGERQAGLEQALGDMGQRIDVLDQATQAAQATQIIQRTQQVEDSRRVNQEIVSATDQLKRTVMPVMEARNRIANQLDEVATMNPLERGLRSIFDLNYDQDYLTSQLERFDRTLQARMYDYEYLDTLQSVSLREIDRRYGIETALSDLEVQQGAEDLALVNQRLGLASEMLGSSRDELATQSQLIVAQAQARENIMSRIDTPTILNLMNQAQTNGGIVNYEGLEFSYKELRDRAELGEQQQRAIRSNQLALAQGEMALAEGIATDLTRSLTREQLEEAAANGGVWNGVQLPQDAITAALAGHRERATGQAQDILTRMPGHIAEQTGVAALNSMTSLFYRTRSMLSQNDKKMSAAMLKEGSEIMYQLADAVRNPNTPPEVMQALLMKVGQAQQNYQSLVSQSILRSVGGDKQAAGYIESFVHGTPMNPGTSAEALTYFALKGGLPDGLAVSPEARQVFIKAQKIANENRTQNGKPVSFDRLKAIVQGELSQYAAQIVGTPRLTDALTSLPTHAKAINHPFGKISNDWWRKTYTEANTYAAAELAASLKTTPQNVQRMMERMEALDSTPQSQKLFESFMQQAGRYNSLEQGFILDKLDSVNPLVPGRPNSELFEELLYSPEFHQRVNKTIEVIEGNSFGDFLVGPMTQGASQSALLEYAGQVGEAAASNRVSSITAARSATRGWGYSPVMRAEATLTAIPGIGKPGAAKLMPFIRQVLPNNAGNRYAMPIGADPETMQMNPHAESVSTLGEFEILEALRKTKFDDPSMEAYRKAAIQHWSEYSQIGDAIMSSMANPSRR